MFDTENAEKMVQLFNAGVIGREEVRDALGLEPEAPSLRDRVRAVRRQSWNCSFCQSRGIPAAAGGVCWNCGRPRFDA